MKWNWGTKIFIAIIMFMTMMIVLVILTMRQSYDLVEKDYYPKGLEYQKKIDKETNANNVGEMIQLENKKTELLITFPSAFTANDVKGDIIFYRPSDGSKDVTLPIKLDSFRKMTLSTDNLVSGKYIIKFDYKVKETKYFQKASIFIEK